MFIIKVEIRLRNNNYNKKNFFFLRTHDLSV